MISGLYNAFRKILETLIGNDKNKAFRQPVLVEYPRRDLWTIAFITGPVYEEISRIIDFLTDTTINTDSLFLERIALPPVPQFIIDKEVLNKIVKLQLSTKG
mgnify:CR=1 FL=1